MSAAAQTINEDLRMHCEAPKVEKAYREVCAHKGEPFKDVLRHATAYAESLTDDDLELARFFRL